MHRIKTVCLGNSQEIVGNFLTVEQLKEEVLAKNRKYLRKNFSEETQTKFILTYHDDDMDEERLLTDINTIPKNLGKWFHMSVKRVWDSCPVCQQSFCITSDRLPYECANVDCGCQYCGKCVKSIKACIPKNVQFTCIFCNKSKKNAVKQNRLLIDLLSEQYFVKYGFELFATLQLMPGALLNDISSRVIHMQVLIEKVEKIEDTIADEEIRMHLRSANELILKLKGAQNSAADIKERSLGDDQLALCAEGYKSYLTGSHSQPFQTFMELCESLLYDCQKAALMRYFPSLCKLITEEKSVSDNSQQHLPKIIDVFKALQKDLGQHVNLAIPLRVGFVGEISVGKTSLQIRLRNIRSLLQSQSGVRSSSQLSSPVYVGKSTFCRLECEHEYEDGKKVIFVDIEGSTDADSYLKPGNYFDTIRNADCDLYIIVYENQFTNIHRGWYDYIVTTLKRQCILVRNKVDCVFNKKYEENVGQNFDDANDEEKLKNTEKVITLMRQIFSFGLNGKSLPNVFLTVAHDEKNLEKYSSMIPALKFDLEKLSNHIRNLSNNLQSQRRQQMALNVFTEIVNTLYRRGYIVNILKYNVAAAIAAIVPCGDLIPRYLARENIRQKFGINDSTWFMKLFSDKKDEFKEYLNEFGILIDKNGFKTSALKNIFKSIDNTTAPTSSQDTAQEAGQLSANLLAKTAVSAGFVGISVSDDILRATGVIALNATRGVSIGLLVFGGVATAAMCCWAFYSNNKQIYSYLNRLCDDLIFLSVHITAKIIEKNNEIREQSPDSSQTASST